MEFKLGKEEFKKGLTVAKRISKAVVVEGVKSLALKTAAASITAAFEGKGVSEVNLDTVLGPEKKKDDSKGWFSRKKKKDEVEVLIEELNVVVEDKKDVVKDVIKDEKTVQSN